MKEINITKTIMETTQNQAEISERLKKLLNPWILKERKAVYKQMKKTASVMEKNNKKLNKERLKLEKLLSGNER